jgi:hypothetical protein
MNRIVRLAHVEANRTPEDLALLLAVWWEVLGTYPAGDVQAKVLQFMAENPWPPKVSQILELLDGTDKTTAGNARAAVMAMAKAGRFRPDNGGPTTPDEYPNEAARLAAVEMRGMWNTKDEAYLLRMFDETYARHATNLAREARQTAAGSLTAGSGPKSIGTGDQ